MNKNELYNLLSGKKSLSKEEINSSMKDNSNFDTSNLDNFEREAIEGWKSSGANQVDTSRVSDKLGFNASRLNLILATLISVILITVLIWPNLNKEIEKAKNEIKPTYIEKTDLFISEKFDTLFEQPKTIAIEINSLKSTQGTKPVVNKTVEETTPVYQIDELPIKPLGNKKEPIKLDTRKKVKEIYFHTFKLVDYRTIRSKPTISTKQLDLTGTAANLENQNNNENEIEWTTVEIPYIDYINKTMYYMDKGSLKNALSRFEIILEKYPDDINALFYSGFALYNLEEYKNAQKSFELALQNPLSNFDEETMWYLALCYEKGGDTNKSQILFQSIAKSNSYYSAEASKKL